MNPAKSSSSPIETHRPTRAAEGPPKGRARSGMGVGTAAVWLGLSGILVAAACAYGLSLWLGPGSPWAAALGAALGLAAAALPLTVLLRRVSGTMPLPHGADGLGDSLDPVGVERELFMNLAEREWARARRYGSGAALLWVDVDRYARLCESRGTAAGDAVLMQLLLKTAPTLRPADLITRMRNGRMAVFLAHADATGALDVAERIRERAEQQQVQMHAHAHSPVLPAGATDAKAHSGPALRVTVSVGVATLRPAHLNLQALMDDADEAVAAARQAGGNCVRAAPVDAARLRDPGKWGGEDRRTRPTKPKQGGSTK